MDMETVPARRIAELRSHSRRLRSEDPLASSHEASPDSQAQGREPADQKKLTGRQARFVDEYTTGMSATAAAIRAGYSPASASSQGYQLLQNPRVMDAIRTKQAEVRERIDVTRDMVIQEYARLAFTENYERPIGAGAKRAALADLVELLGLNVPGAKEPISIVVRYDDGESDVLAQNTD